MVMELLPLLPGALVVVATEVLQAVAVLPITVVPVEVLRIYGSRILPYPVG